MDAHGRCASDRVAVWSPPESSSYPLTSDFILVETVPHRDRLVPFCRLFCARAFSGGKKGLVEMLKRYIDACAKGFGEHKPGVRMDSPQNLALFAAWAEVKLPVLFHLDNERNIDTPGLPGLAKVLSATPELPFIGPRARLVGLDLRHTSPRLSWGAILRGEVSERGAVPMLMSKFSNLYGDLSVGSGANAIRRNLKFGCLFLIRRADRQMNGTDFLSPGQDVPQFALFDELDLPEEVAAKIFQENASGVLQL